jgi:hypothetical protein
MGERIKAPDGTYVTFPDGTPDSVINRAMREYVRRSTPGYRKARENLKGESDLLRKRALLPGLDDWAAQVGRNTGAADDIAGGVVFARQGVENLFRRATGRPIEVGAGEAGLAAMDQEREAQTRYAREKPVANFFANAATIATTARPTGAPMFANPFAAGAAAAVQNAPFALARQDGTLAERAPGAARETALTFGTAGLMTAGANRLARSGTRARTAPPSDARLLSREGVQLTPGQMAGGAVQRVEDAATSIPVIGDSIREARIRGMESFNRAAINRTLAPVGQTLPGDARMGRNAIGAAQGQISDAYDNALVGVTATPDRQFSQDVQTALFSRNLPRDAAEEVDSVIQNSLVRAGSGPIDGNTWKAVDAELRAAADAADAASQNTPSMRFARDTLRDIRRAWQGMLERSAPQARAGVRAADEATANLVRVREASQGAGTAARGGVFSPADLNRAVRAGDSTAGNRAYASGEALMQDLTDPAARVLPSTVPDTGTPLRGIISAGGPAALLGQLGWATPEQLIIGLGTLGAGSALYSRPVQAALNALYRAKEPGMVREALGQIAQLAARDPALAPLYDRVSSALIAPLRDSANPRPTTASRPQPTMQ